MDSLEILTKLKQSVQNARYCNYCDMKPEYKEIALDAKLERIDHLVDKLLEERLK